MMKWAILAAGVVLGGCASTGDDYAGPPEAVARALADCRMRSDAIPATTNAAANPFFAAAYQQQYVTDCMTAKGFRAR